MPTPAPKVFISYSHDSAEHVEFVLRFAQRLVNKASCLSLLSNAVLVWNTVKIGNIVGQLRAAGEQIDDADLSKVSPLAHRHVIPNGTYFHNQPVGEPNESAFAE